MNEWPVESIISCIAQQNTPHHTTPHLHHTPSHFTPLFHAPLPSPLPHFPPMPSTPHTLLTPYTLSHHIPNTLYHTTGVSMDTGSTGAYLSPGSLSSKVGRKPGHRERILAYSTVGYGIICHVFVIFFLGFYFVCSTCFD